MEAIAAPVISMGTQCAGCGLFKNICCDHPSTVDARESVQGFAMVPLLHVAVDLVARTHAVVIPIEPLPVVLLHARRDECVADLVQLDGGVLCADQAVVPSRT